MTWRVCYFLHPFQRWGALTQGTQQLKEFLGFKCGLTANTGLGGDGVHWPSTQHSRGFRFFSCVFLIMTLCVEMEAKADFATCFLCCNAATLGKFLCQLGSQSREDEWYRMYNYRLGRQWCGLRGKEVRPVLQAAMNLNSKSADWPSEHVFRTDPWMTGGSCWMRKLCFWKIQLCLTKILCLNKL
jgi:hypothetical protein